jgi:hypothetical protein
MMKTRYASQLRSANEALGKAKQAGRGAIARTGGKGDAVISSVVVVGGGAVGGVLTARYPDIGGFDSRWVLGALMVAGGIFGLKGKPGAYLTLAGAGVLASAASDKGQEMGAS